MLDSKKNVENVQPYPLIGTLFRYQCQELCVFEFLSFKSEVLHLPPFVCLLLLMLNYFFHALISLSVIQITISKVKYFDIDC